MYRKEKEVRRTCIYKNLSRSWYWDCWFCSLDNQGILFFWNSFPCLPYWTVHDWKPYYSLLLALHRSWSPCSQLYLTLFSCHVMQFALKLGYTPFPRSWLGWMSFLSAIINLTASSYFAVWLIILFCEVV